MSGSPDLVVVGAGLSGLMTALLAARRGAKGVVVARGLGNLHSGTGCVGVLGYTLRGTIVKSPTRSLTRALKDRAGHPYLLAGRDALESGVAALKEVCEAAGYPLAGDLGSNFVLPTALGAPLPVCLVPESMAGGDQSGDGGPWLLVGLASWRDFDAGHAAANLGQGVRAVELELPDSPLDPNLTTLEIARRFDDPDFRVSVARLVSGSLDGAERVGFPAVLGLHDAPAALADLEAKLGCPVFEVPTLPPSVPGVRLYEVLRRAVLALGGEIVLGPAVRGWMEGDEVQGVRTYGPGGQRKVAAGSVVLATGGLLGGGLEAGMDGTLRETAFDLPVDAPPPDDWFDPLFMGRHAIFESGVRVDAAMRPVSAAGDVVSERLYAVGGLLAGADRLGELSAEGIDLATAAGAVTALNTWRARQTL